MRRRMLASALLAAVSATTEAQARTDLAMPRSANSTAYCLGGRMADGSYVRAGSVAMNGVRLGTRIRVSKSPTGRKRFTVRDRIGHGSQLDFWVGSCSTARWWGRRNVRFRYGW